MSLIVAPNRIKLPNSGEPARWQEHLVSKFFGGMATAYSDANLLDSQFKRLTNWYLKDDSTIISRGGFRPLDVAASKESIIPDSAAPKSFFIVDIAGTEYTLVCWDNGTYNEVSYWDQSNNRWAGDGGGTSISTAHFDDDYLVKFFKYSINDLEDVIMFNGEAAPRRWTGSGASTALGLAVPSDLGTEDISDTLDNDDAVDKGDGTVGIPITGHSFSEDDWITIDGSTNYDGSYLVVSESVNEVVITATYTAEEFAGTETAKSPAIAAGGADDVSDDRGITVSGTYYYKMTYTYESSTSTKYGESGPNATAVSEAAADAAATNKVWITFSQLPLIANVDSDITRINFYRSPADSANGPFEYVGYTTTATFVDRCANGSEGAEVVSDAGTPPRLKNAIEFDGRIWGIGLNSSGALKNKGVYSDQGYPDYYDASNYFYLPDPIIGPKEFNENLYWFTEKAIYVIPNADISTYPSPLKVCEIGCDSYDSIVDVGNGLCWQFQGNIYWTNFNLYNDKMGDYPFPIGDPIANQIREIPSGYESNSVGVLYKNRYYLSFTGANQTVNTKTLVWDTKIGVQLLKQGIYGAWTEVDWKANWMMNHQNTLWTADNVNKYLMEHDTGDMADYKSYTDYGKSTSYDIATYIDTGLLHMGHEYDNRLFHSLSLWANTTGTTYTVNFIINDGEFNKSRTYTFAAGAAATTGFMLDVDSLDVGTLGSATGAEYRIDHHRIGHGAKGRNIRLSISCLDSDDTNILGYKLYWRPFKDTA